MALAPYLQKFGARSIVAVMPPPPAYSCRPSSVTSTSCGLFYCEVTYRCTSSRRYIFLPDFWVFRPARNSWRPESKITTLRTSCHKFLAAPLLLCTAKRPNQVVFVKFSSVKLVEHVVSTTRHDLCSQSRSNEIWAYRSDRPPAF